MKFSLINFFCFFVSSLVLVLTPNATRQFCRLQRQKPSVKEVNIMANIVQRSMQRSLAKTISEMEQETGIPQSQLVEILNEEYGYVSKDDPELLSDLNRQIELDRAADRHAKKKKIEVSKRAIAKTTWDRESGKLAQDLQEGNIGGERS
ncbi:TPA: hypothetical protein GRI96_17920 [Vibrio parahaemolyticus]|jgi:hypothetical protein|uniref:hypothetical protein n=1 Tax=Vibrionaceae TaxID=641 RepID=UPI0010568005|nr:MULTISPECIES: hypothetical protein [Vibrionaceae]EII3441632.1 hypothetical protein [Vibrio parahaemolyticus]ELA7840544.1 hypothetical protein [Vibrio parahaemolyticus]MDF4689770.1 hypothetical protein [Vibrio parahaemolyticus]HAS6807103.1 hypothetical protein [Vibrio parahaemolyticus]HAS6822916.1 hypothetical protein [Vibrio parahaemolyticus]